MTEPGTELAMSGAYDDSITGLEDFGVEDLKLPRLSIDHEKGGYVDSLAPEMAYPKIEVIPLGLVKQRVLWPAIMDDSAKRSPMCRSVDNTSGYPNTVSTDPLEAFPWQATGWNPNDFPKDDVGRTQLPCGTCRLKEWGSHPDGKKTWCSQQYAIVLLYGPEGAEPSMVALYTAQRSSINSAKAFFGTIARQQLPAFAVKGTWGLTAQMRGKNKYYVPTMVVTGRTDQGTWPVYQKNYLQVRDHVTRPPRVADDQQQANVSGQNIAAQNVNPGFQNNTWTPGAQQAPIQGQVVQVTPAQPAVDPQREAFEKWQREQAAAQAASTPGATITAPGTVAAGVPIAVAEPTAMPFPAPAQPSTPTAPVAGGARDEEPLPF